MLSLEANSLMAEEYNNVVEHFKASMMNVEGNKCVPLDLDAVVRLKKVYEGLLDEKLGQIMDLDEAVIGSPSDREHVTAIPATLDQVVKEIEVICSDINKIIDNFLLRNAIGDRERALIYNFKGDFHRKKWAMNPDDITSCEEATKAYYNALTICKWNFEPTDMHLLQIALSYSMHLNEANKYDEAIVTLTGVISNAQETFYNNGDTEITEKKYVQSMLENLNDTLSFSRVNSDLRLEKLIEQLESENNRRCGQDFGDEEELLSNDAAEESWSDDEGEMWDDDVEEKSWDNDEAFRDDIEEKLHKDVEEVDEEFFQIISIQLD